MPDNDFGKSITAAARTVARVELKRRKLRKQLQELDNDYRRAQGELRLLVQSVQPYEPPAALTQAELDAQDAEGN